MKGIRKIFANGMIDDSQSQFYNEEFFSSEQLSNIAENLEKNSEDGSKYEVHEYTGEEN